MAEWFQRPRRDYVDDAPPWHQVAVRRPYGGASALCGADSYSADYIKRTQFAAEPGDKVCAKCKSEAKRLAAGSAIHGDG